MREVVDTFADARDRDILNLAEEMEQDMEADKRLGKGRSSVSHPYMFR